ncbi:MAG: PIG-L family deacetylase, partial [Gemmatimonadales bacterium]
PRLLAWVRNGGLMVVQYQQYAYFRRGYAPYQLTVGSPHDRITDQTAPVEPLPGGEVLLDRPNRITAADWRGWVQERGLYFARTWDDAWKPALRMQDPGQPPLDGGLLIARYGEGTYVYTGISFFRELPAGVTGAMRLLANLLALGTAPPP